jgi:protein gp37
VSVENQKHGVPRIEHLRQAPAAVRFLSIEPLLEDVGRLNLDGIAWVIVGGESGPGARPMQRDWVLAIKLQCVAANVPFFFKQWGGVRKSEAGRLLDGRAYDEMPCRVENEVVTHKIRKPLMEQVKGWRMELQVA